MTSTDSTRTTYPKKVLLLGDGGVGKTTFIKTLLGVSSFRELYTYTPTLGVEVYSYFIPGSNNQVEIWDCAGQERFSFKRTISEHTDGVILFCDGTSRISRANLKNWKTIAPLGIPSITVQLKSDVRQKFAPNDRILVSAKTGYNIETPLALLDGLMS